MTDARTVKHKPDSVKLMADGGPIDGTPKDDILEGDAGDDVINGLNGDDQLSGFEGDDQLNGGAGDDVLRGGGGVDVMVGGSGDDIYFVNDTGDQVIELTANGRDSGGRDKIIASLAGSWELPRRIEELKLVGTDFVQVFANDFSNKVIGNAGVQSVFGARGDDRLFGMAGDDQLVGDQGEDRLFGGQGNDRLFGGDDDDELFGGRGDDLLVGHNGADIMYGGVGADRFFLDEPTSAGADGRVDLFADFSPEEGDRIGLDRVAYGLPFGQPLDPARFSDTGVATSPAGVGQFVFDRAERTLSWDPDGSGTGVAILLARLSTSNIDAGDFFVG